MAYQHRIPPRWTETTTPSAICLPCKRQNDNDRNRVRSSSLTHAIDSRFTFTFSLSLPRLLLIVFQRFCHHLFNKQLPLKPKPWRVTLLLELLYGGWTIIRPAVLACLRRFKDIQLLTLLNLVDNYRPLALAIYSIYFKSNAFFLDNKAMMQGLCILYFNAGTTINHLWCGWQMLLTGETPTRLYTTF